MPLPGSAQYAGEFKMHHKLVERIDCNKSGILSEERERQDRGKEQQGGAPATTSTPPAEMQGQLTRSAPTSNITPIPVQVPNPGRERTVLPNGRHALPDSRPRPSPTTSPESPTGPFQVNGGTKKAGKVKPRRKTSPPTTTRIAANGAIKKTKQSSTELKSSSNTSNKIGTQSKKPPTKIKVVTRQGRMLAKIRHDLALAGVVHQEAVVDGAFDPWNWDRDALFGHLGDLGVATEVAFCLWLHDVNGRRLLVIDDDIESPQSELRRLLAPQLKVNKGTGPWVLRITLQNLREASAGYCAHMAEVRQQKIGVS